MNSMTGFGRAVGTVDGRPVVIEIRSVNSRGLDVKVRGRSLSAAAEIETVRLVRGSLARGSVQVTVSIEEAAGTGGLPLEALRTLARSLEILRADLGLPGPLDLATLAAFLRLGPDREGERPLPWEGLAPLCEQALAALQTMRAEEGRALVADMRWGLARLSEMVDRMATAVAPLPQRAAERLRQRLTQLAAQAPLDPARLAQEAALLAERLDVSEELARLRTHLERLGELYGKQPEQRVGVGRTLDFLIQEIGRELNTLGSKAQDAEVAALVIQAKTELEKIREQAQNIE